jgi:hypothetical protein
MLFEAALQEQKINWESHFLRIPSLGISVDVRVVRIRSLVLACSKSPLVVRWDTQIQKEIDEGSVSYCPDGFYFTENPELDEVKTESDYPRHLGLHLMQNFKKTGKLDWRIVYGEDENEKPIMWGMKVAFEGERFIWDEDLLEAQIPSLSEAISLPKEQRAQDIGIKTMEKPKEAKTKEDPVEFILEDGSADCAKIAERIDID